MTIADPLTLPCGVTLRNRLAKGAMTEGLASPAGLPTPELNRLYALWARGGAGLLITGNVQIDRDHLERPGNVVIDREPGPEMMTALAAWADAGTSDDTQLWMQISHAGRQTQKPVNPTPKAPSAVGVDLPGGRFGKPVALTDAEIVALIARFATAARAAQSAGFTGVQVHGAHGYLLSQFLSPRANHRDDRWGDSLENRARPLLDAVRAVRAAVGPAFPMSVKLNSADFQRGGFALADSITVARWLRDEGVDLLEVSGGSYEQPAMMDLIGLEQPDRPAVRASTAAREAYFIEFAAAMKAQVPDLPLMVTGGFRTRAAMDHALASGAADLIGLGRPLCATPDAPRALLDKGAELPRHEATLSMLPRPLRGLTRNDTVRAISVFAEQMWYYAQLDHLGRHGAARPAQSVLSALWQVERHAKRWLAARR